LFNLILFLLLITIQFGVLVVDELSLEFFFVVVAVVVGREYHRWEARHEEGH
jgi:hypothetical protein